jgi:hypothetical protein
MFMKSSERSSVFNFHCRFLVCVGIYVLFCAFVCGCYETPSLSGTWKGHVLPTTLYSVDRKTTYHGGSLQIVTGPDAPDMLTKEARKAAGPRLMPILVDREYRILDFSEVSPQEMVEVTGCYRSLGAVEDYRGGEVGFVPWDKDSQTGQGFLMTTIEVSKVKDVTGKKVPLKNVSRSEVQPRQEPAPPNKP